MSGALDVDAIDQRLADAVAATDVPGASLAVLVDGDLVHVASAGVLDVSTGVPVTPDSVFQVGSTTKVMTAAVVLQLTSPVSRRRRRRRSRAMT